MRMPMNPRHTLIPHGKSGLECGDLGAAFIDIGLQMPNSLTKVHERKAAPSRSAPKIAWKAILFGFARVQHYYVRAYLDQDMNLSLNLDFKF